MVLQEFPKELLDSPLLDRHEYFKKYTVSHPAFEEAFNELLKRIYNGAKNSIILVYGPTGAGKSKLVEKVKEKILKDNIQLYQTNRGLLPVLVVESVPPDSGNFDWKDFYYRSLVAAEEELIDYKEIYLEDEETGKLTKVKGDTKAALRRSLENVLKLRQPLAFIIDEAQHITMTTSGRNFLNQINILKSLANIGNVPLVLTGNYDLLTYRDLNGQTIRRGKDVHVRRYQADNEKDIEAYINVLLAFQKHLPLENEPDLIEHWDYFYSRTIGSVGILKDWFYLTYQIKSKENETLKTLTVEDFRKYELSTDKCLKLLDEASKGEEKIKKSNDSEYELYQKLGLIEIEENEPDIKKDNEKESKKKTRKPGQRKPKRDKVGLEEVDKAQ